MITTCLAGYQPQSIKVAGGTHYFPHSLDPYFLCEHTCDFEVEGPVRQLCKKPVRTSNQEDLLVIRPSSDCKSTQLLRAMPPCSPKAAGMSELQLPISVTSCSQLVWVLSSAQEARTQLEGNSTVSKGMLWKSK
jgi:hypothetical protein